MFSVILSEYACHSYRLSRFEQARTAAQRALELARAVREDGLVVRALDILGQIAWQVGDFAASSRYLQEALALAEQQNDVALRANLIRSVGWVEDVKGNYAGAKSYLRTSLALFRELNLPHEIVNNLNALGYLYVESGHPREAQPFFGEGLRLSRETGVQVMVPHLLSGAGLALYELGEYAAAQSTLQEALRETAGELAEAWVLVLLGRTATATADHALARTYLERSLKTSWSVQMWPEVLDALVALTEMQLAQGHVIQAAATLRAVLPHAALAGYSRALAERLERKLQRHSAAATEGEVSSGGGTLAEIVGAFLN